MPISIGRRMTRAVIIGMAMAFLVGLGLYFLVTGVNLVALTPVYVPEIVNGTLTAYKISPMAGAPFNATAVMLLGAGSILLFALGIELSQDITDSQAASTNPTIATSEITPLVAAINDLREQIARTQGQKKQEEGPPKP